MKKSDDLPDIRQQLREKIAKRVYTNIADELLAYAGRFFKIQPDEPFFIEVGSLFWVSCGVMWSVLVLFATEPRGQALDDFLFMLPLPLIVYLGFVGTQKFWRFVMDIIANHVLESLHTRENILDLEDWLRSWTNHRTGLVWSILFAILLDASFFMVAITFGEITPRLSLVIAYLPILIQMGMFFFDFLRAINLPLRIQHYRFKLYQADPASSEVIARLAGIFTSLIFLIAATATIVTLLIAVFDPLPVASSILSVAIGWIPLLIAFVTTQNALRHIIKNGKQKALSEIQSKIEKLQAKEEIPSGETLKHIRALIDYHDYIKTRRDSTFDIQTGLNFLNSLLFPVIGFLLGNLKELLAFFSK